MLSKSRSRSLIQYLHQSTSDQHYQNTHMRTINTEMYLAMKGTQYTCMRLHVTHILINNYINNYILYVSNWKFLIYIYILF